MNISKTIVMVFACCLWFLFCFDRTAAETFISMDLFHIKRNKNSNLVQYSVYVDQQSCRPQKTKPAHVFWRNLEISDTDVSNLLLHEIPAYGIDSQSVKGNVLHLRLEALPERLISIEFDGTNSQCKVTPYVSINNEKSRLNEIYVFAKERWYWAPDVKWIEIRGINLQGSPIKERINVD